MHAIIRAEALEHLPFSAEPLHEWSDDCDCHRFLREQFHREPFVVDVDGEERRVEPRDSGTHVFRDETRALRKRARSFSKAAESALHMDAEKDPDLTRDPLFGLACKYMAAWNGVVAPIGTFIGYPWVHLRGLRADMECSFHLVGAMYYKHAMLTLRELVERVIVPVAFADDPIAFGEWREGRLDTPPMRGGDGLLAAVAREGRLPGALADEAAGLLGEIDAYAHGSRDHLFRRVHIRGGERGVMFRPERLEMWARHFARSTDWAIRVTALHPGFFFEEEEPRPSGGALPPNR